MKEKLSRMEVSMYSFGSSIHDKVEAELKELKTKMNNSGDFVVVNTRDEQILTDIQELKDENKLLKSVIKDSMYALLSYRPECTPTRGCNLISDNTNKKIYEIIKQLE